MFLAEIYSGFLFFYFHIYNWSISAVYGRRRKRIGRPPGGHSNLENGQKKPGKRKKRRIGMMGHRKSPSPDGQENGEDDKVSWGYLL